MTKKLLGCFGSDNFSGVAPEIMQALIEANEGSAAAYGGDRFTMKAQHVFQQHFGASCHAYFAFNGTGANVASLSAILGRCDSIIAADTAHIVTQETAAIFAFAGCKVITIPSVSGKIQPDDIEKGVMKETFWSRHASLPKVVTISQATEYGTVYSLQEIAEIAKVCKRHKLLVHVDGCRLANAAVELSASLRDFNQEIGIDVMTFGGTKNGMMFGEAILFFNKELSSLFPYMQKQSLQLASKMRYIAAQFICYLEKGLWRSQALHANKMANMLYEGLKTLPGVSLAHPLQTNQLFITMPRQWIDELQQEFELILWDPSGLARMITSWNTKEEEVMSFLSKIQQIAQGTHG